MSRLLHVLIEHLIHPPVNPIETVVLTLVLGAELAIVVYIYDLTIFRGAIAEFLTHVRDSLILYDLTLFQGSIRRFLTGMWDRVVFGAYSSVRRTFEWLTGRGEQRIAVTIWMPPATTGTNEKDVAQ